MGFGDVISGAFEIYGKSAVQMWQIVALVVVPLMILAIIIRRLSLPSDVFLRDGTLYTFGSTSTGVGGAITQNIILVLSTWLATGALFHLQLDTYLGRPHDPADSLAYFGHRVFQLIGLGVLTFFAVLSGVVLLVVGIIWLAVSFSIAFPVLMLEGKTWFSALGRSMGLVRGRWWVTFGRLIVTYIIVGVWSTIIGGIGAAIAGGLSNVTAYEIVLGVTYAVGLILFLPFSSAAINLIYLDLRARKEGLTDDMLMDRPRDPAHTVEANDISQLGSPSPAGPGEPPASPPAAG